MIVARDALAEHRRFICNARAELSAAAVLVDPDNTTGRAAAPRA